MQLDCPNSCFMQSLQWAIGKQQQWCNYVQLMHYTIDATFSVLFFGQSFCIKLYIYSITHAWNKTSTRKAFLLLLWLCIYYCAHGEKTKQVFIRSAQITTLMCALLEKQSDLRQKYDGIISVVIWLSVHNNSLKWINYAKPVCC